MWSVLFSGAVELVKGWFDVKKAKQQAEAAYQMKKEQGEQDWDLEAMRQAQYSWKDELITIIIFAPLIVAWFDVDAAVAWTEFVSAMPFWYQVVMFGIVAASFGLRWWFKQQSFTIPKKKAG